MGAFQQRGEHRVAGSSEAMSLDSGAARGRSRRLPDTGTPALCSQGLEKKSCRKLMSGWEDTGMQGMVG